MVLYDDDDHNEGSGLPVVDGGRASQVIVDSDACNIDMDVTLSKAVTNLES